MFEDGLLAFAEHLPGHDIRVVFESADEDLVALVDICLAEREREGIETVRCTFGEDDLIAALGMDEVRYHLSRLFVMTRRYLTQMMHATVNITVPRGISFHDGIQHGLRLLTRGGVIQVHQFSSVYLLFQYWKIGSVHGL